MFTKNEILNIAKKQLALDFSCDIDDLEKIENTVVEKQHKVGRRIYDNDRCSLKILCFGRRAVVSTTPEIMPWFQEKLDDYDANWLFLIPVLKNIDRMLEGVGHEIADIHHFYLPLATLEDVEPITDIRWYEQDDIIQFENDDRFDEAFGFDDNHPDVLGIAALNGDEIIGMAGASRDCEDMWQIGINVMEGYRGKGIATNLVSLLKNEIMKRGKIPFYGTIESNIYSQGVAIKSGFIPVWVELSSREKRL
ncbi:GNAT family N-acetyltransferase [Clostridium sp. ATCC 25772]|uniref:GNAT family N-acetyltransferase n=1 Tax=Clostridium sp. ATCC 25772 TaxID=1676991 RepID=UPI000783D05A|nr:GNAT family N-acetyltransferase [Clostridium sp. ATCC 25772]